MKRKRLICIVFALILLTSATACQKPSETEETGDFRSSVDMIAENMALDDTAAIDVLETLTSLGLDERIEYVYEVEDANGKMYYKVWFGLNLLSVYLDGSKVSEVYKYGERIYPQSDDEETTNKNNNDNNNGANKTEDASKELKIEIISLTSPVETGKNATIEILGEPEMEYDITVTYSSGASSASGLEPKYSDSNGHVSWTWKVSANVKPGEYSITITSGDAAYKTTFVVE